MCSVLQVHERSRIETALIILELFLHKVSSTFSSNAFDTKEYQRLVLSRLVNPYDCLELVTVHFEGLIDIANWNIDCSINCSMVLSW